MIDSGVGETVPHDRQEVSDPIIPAGNEQGRNVFQDIHAEDDVHQFIGSANKNTTTAKSISAKAHTTQCFGDMADSTFQQISSNRGGNAERRLIQPKSVKPGKYGEGQRLGSGLQTFSSEEKKHS